jgi:aminoglycoside phosphotransferase family enzyme/predicted kinase
MATAAALAEAEIAALASPHAYPRDPSAAAGVEHVQTHLSHVFLTGERVYKFRKGVDLGFVCFRSRAERNADCLREVALNRRLSPDVYLGVAPLERGGAGVRIGPLGEVLAGDLEHCVVMRRLPAGGDALSLLEAGRLTAPQLERLARRVAAFHDAHGLGVPAPFGPEEWSERVLGPVDDNFRLLAAEGEPGVPGPLLEALQERERVRREEVVGRIESRRRDGRVVDAHGDLHLQHVWFESEAAEPRIVDCIEFNERLRHIDTASEVAFTAMDLRYRGRPDLAEHFLGSYARERDDFDLYTVVDWFASYRAAVRAKVAAIAAGEPEIAEAQRTRAAASVRRHLVLAGELLAAPQPGPLVVVAGSVGTGKSTAAAILAETLGGAVVQADRVRKRLAGMAPTERQDAGWREGIYAPEHTERTYAGLLERARPVLGSGRACVLDATFATRRHRAAARALAAELGAESLLVETVCAEAVALERLARREESGAAVSDAGPAQQRRSREAFESCDEWPLQSRLRLPTDAENWRDLLRQRAAQLRP